MFFVGDTFQVSELVMGWCILEVGSNEWCSKKPLDLKSKENDSMVNILVTSNL